MENQTNFIEFYKVSATGVMEITTEEPFGLADGRVIEVKSGDDYYAINLYQGNGPIEHLAYREDLRLTFTVVRVGLRNELVSYAAQELL